MNKYQMIQVDTAHKNLPRNPEDILNENDYLFRLILRANTFAANRIVLAKIF